MVIHLPSALDPRSPLGFGILPETSAYGSRKGFTKKISLGRSLRNPWNVNLTHNALPRAASRPWCITSACAVRGDRSFHRNYVSA